MFSKSKSILKRGYRFGKLCGASYPEKIETLPLPDKVVIPLKQGFSVETHCLVKKGDRVRAGEIIGRDDHTYSTPVHSTVNGIVEYFESFMENQEPHFGVVIRRDYDDNRDYIPVPGAGHNDKTREEIGEILYLSGVTSLGSTGIPSFHHTSDLDIENVEAIVVNGLSTEPFSLPYESLITGRADDFITGLNILVKLLNPGKDVHIAFPTGSVILKTLSGRIGEEVHLHGVEPKYPLHCDEIITEITTGRRVPDGGTPSEVNVVLVTAQDVFHVYDAVVSGKPLIEKIVSIGGTACKQSKLAKITIGSPIEWLILDNIREDVDNRVLIGGAMKGEPIVSPSHPVERDFSSITVLEENRDKELLYFLKPGLSSLSFSRSYLSSFLPNRKVKPETNLQGEKRPCIYCSYCEDACPRQLVPHLYSRMVNFDLAEDAVKYGMEACIECGLCTFVCPSKITLVEDIRKGKKILEKREIWAHPTGLSRLESEGKITG